VAIACKEHNIKMVYYSTDYVFDGEKGEPYTEDDRPSPVNYYGVTKLEGENRIAAILDNFLILRVAWLFANHKKAFVNKVIEKGRKQVDLKKEGILGEPEKIVDDQIGSPTYAYDVARQTKKILETELSGIYHCVSEGATSRYSLAKYIYEYLAMPVDILPCKASEYNWIAPRPRNTALGNTKLTEESINIMPYYKDAVTEYLIEFVK
jgi:dTDP-4-dehydrorhamnose reductase